MQKYILVKVKHKADGLFHAVCPGLFGFRIVTETAQDMMTEAPKFAKTFFGDGIEPNITYEWTSDRIVFHFVVEEDEVGYKGRCVERPDMTVWAADVGKLVEAITMSGARVISTEYLPAELCSVHVIRSLKRVEIELSTGTTGDVATSPDIRELTTIAPFGGVANLREECCEIAEKLLKASGQFDLFEYIIDFKDLT